MSTIRDVTMHEVSIKGETFETFRTDFDKILTKTLNNMREKDLDEAEITVKMTVKARKKEVENPTVENLAETRTAIVPVFNHKITTVYKVESKVEGQLANGYELIYDEQADKYVLVEIDNGQCAFDGMGTYATAQPVEADGVVVDSREGLPAPSILLEDGTEAEDEE